MPKVRITTKHLESYLQTLDDFGEPKVELEQYATPPHIAALMLNEIYSEHCDIRDKFVADLGCGTGRLTIGSLICEARMVYGFDIDGIALVEALQNVVDFFGDDDTDKETPSAYRACEKVNFIQADISVGSDSMLSRFHKKFDTVIMNPPFGTKHNKGLDMLFLEKAIDLSDRVVYSLHKTSTRDVSKKIKSNESSFHSEINLFYHST